MPKLFVITGTPASGKSTLLASLAEKGFPVISADEIVANLYQTDSKIIDEITSHFGTSVKDSNGQIARNRLREKVISDAVGKKWLENLIHPRVREVFVAWLANQSEDAECFYEIPLYFEVKFSHPDLKGVIVCFASRETSMDRLQKRGLAGEEAGQLLDLQLSADEKRARADYLYDSEHDTPGKFENLLAWVQSR